jgi:hypothetical protein
MFYVNKGSNIFKGAKLDFEVSNLRVSDPNKFPGLCPDGVCPAKPTFCKACHVQDVNGNEKKIGAGDSCWALLHAKNQNMGCGCMANWLNKEVKEAGDKANGGLYAKF